MQQHQHPGGDSRSPFNQNGTPEGSVKLTNGCGSNLDGNSDSAASSTAKQSIAVTIKTSANGSLSKKITPLTFLTGDAGTRGVSSVAIPLESSRTDHLSSSDIHLPTAPDNASGEIVSRSYHDAPEVKESPVQKEHKNSSPAELVLKPAQSTNQSTNSSPNATVYHPCIRVQPKTIFIKNMATIGTPKAKSTGSSSLQILDSSSQKQKVDEELRKTDSFVPVTSEATQNRKPILHQASVDSIIDEGEVEYEVFQYVIEEIESTAKVSIHRAPTLRDLWERFISNPFVPYLVLLVLILSLLCILTEGEISLAWTLAAISIASVAAFEGFKM